MDSEVSRTLAELERKLQELERALAAASHGERQRSGQSEPRLAGHAPGAARLVDEGLEGAADPQRAGHDTPPEAVPQPPPSPIGTGAPEQPRHDFGESIELSELVRFRDRLQHTLRELAEDYEQIICLRGASASPQPPNGER